MEPLNEHEPSTSASTLRGLRHIDMALLAEQSASPAPAWRLSTLAQDDNPESPYAFRPSSPHSGYPSEPGSPSGDSVSSFPSVGSSFLFSSVPVTPPHPGPHPEPVDDELGDSTSGLVIPSLLLPSPSRRPTAYGQTLGEVRLLLLGPKNTDVSAIVSQLLDDNDDVVEVGTWEQGVLRVSTDWVEHRDRHGLERVEPARNLEIVELPCYDAHCEIASFVEQVLPAVHHPFQEILSILNQEHSPSGTLAHLLSSSSTPLYTALILLSSSSSLSPTERSLVERLSQHIPIVLLPPTATLTRTASRDRLDPAPHYRSSHLSSFRPTSLDALRAGLFRTPAVLAALRAEAASRFLRWREVERAVERVQRSTGIASSPAAAGAPAKPIPSGTSGGGQRWDKEAWEAQWEGSLSQEAALHLRRRKLARTSGSPPRRTAPLSAAEPPVHALHLDPAAYTAALLQEDDDAEGAADPAASPARGRCAPAFDPLHLPSLVVFSFSLLRALGARLVRRTGVRPRPALRQRSSTITSVPRRADVEEEEEETEKRAHAGDKPSAGRGVGYTIGLGFALVSAFCAGIGIGLVAASRFRL